MDKVVLSASKLATLNKCSFVYWMTYVNGIRGKDNDGSRRGTVCHIIFECLLKERHRQHYDSIIKCKSVEGSVAICKLINKISKKIGLGEYDNKGQHNFDLINSMILVGLSCDFHCKDQKLEKAELEFYYEGTNYIIRGGIDKIAKKGPKYSAYDYKSSSEKYKGEENDFNVQSLLYSLFFYKQYGVIPFFRFIFLRYEDDPFIDKTFTEQDLLGFEDYLVYISEYLKNFDFKKAISNLAAEKGYPTDGSFSGMLACGYSKYPGHIQPKTGKPYFCCSFKHPKKFYYVKKSGGEVRHVVDDLADLDLQDGDYFEEFDYKGCWWWYRASYE
jgi:hypothetical protein